MTTTLWDTSGTEIVQALVAQRHLGGAVASGLALTLIVVCDESAVAQAEAAATVAAAAHPCRLLVVVRRKLEADDRLDAEIDVGGVGSTTETVVMRMFGRLVLHAESVVLPLLAPDTPVVTWWHGPAPAQIAYDPLGVLADRRVTDAACAADPLGALRQRAEDFAPGDTDLAWTRTTPWRSLLAAAFDDGDLVAEQVRVEAETGNPSAPLLAAWLGSRLEVPWTVADSGGPGVTAVDVTLRDDGALRLHRPDGRLATLSRSGMPDRNLPLPRRDAGDLLAEELRRLDADQPYAEALAAATGVPDLAGRSPTRTHVWRDPAQQAAAG